MKKTVNITKTYNTVVRKQENSDCPNCCKRCCCCCEVLQLIIRLIFVAGLFWVLCKIGCSVERLTLSATNTKLVEISNSLHSVSDRIASVEEGVHTVSNSLLDVDIKMNEVVRKITTTTEMFDSQEVPQKH